MVQAQSTSSNWGEWSPTYFATTRSADDGPIPGKLRLVSAGHDNLRVNWIVPPVIREMIDRYLVANYSLFFSGMQLGNLAIDLIILIKSTHITEKLLLIFLQISLNFSLFSMIALDLWK